MERLTTYRNGAYAYVGPGCKYPNTGDIAIEMDTGSVRAVLQKLAAYEDTELTPEDVARLKDSTKPITIQDMGRFQEIMRAEKDERLILLPCKTTDTVYVLESVFKGKKVIGGRVVSAQIDRVIIGGTTGKPVLDLCSETGNWYKSMEPGDFYLTKEEAEKVIGT